MWKPHLNRLLPAVVLSAALVLAGCGGSSQPPSPQPAAPSTQPAAPAPAPKQDVVLNIGLNADPPKLDPHQSSAAVDRQVFQSLFDKLVDIDKDLKIIPMLAEKWEVSGDGKAYTFTLRQGVKFHDGTDFGAEAVKYNFERMLDPKLNSPRKAEIKQLDKVTVVDPHTVKVELKKPDASFLYALTDRAGMMVSPEAAQKVGLDFLNAPVGTGPFKFKARVKGDSITLVKHDAYWQAGLPKAAGVVFKTVTDENVKLVQLQSGQLDLIDTVPSKQLAQLKGDSRLKLVMGNGLAFQGIWINTTRAPLNNKKVRQAINAAIDREALMKVVFGEGALPGDSPFAPGTPANDGAALLRRDVALAKQLLAEAGLPDGFSATLKFQPAAFEQQMGQVLQSMLAEAGIKITLEPTEFGQLLDQLGKKNYDLGRLGWSGRPDPDGNSTNFLFTGTTNNYSGFSNPQVDKLLDDARLPTEMAQRKPIYGEIVKVVRDEVPYVYLYHPLEIKGLGPAVEGFTHVPDGMIRTVNLSK